MICERRLNVAKGAVLCSINLIRVLAFSLNSTSSYGLLSAWTELKNKGVCVKMRTQVSPLRLKLRLRLRLRLKLKGLPRWNIAAHFSQGWAPLDCLVEYDNHWWVYPQEESPWFSETVIQQIIYSIIYQYNYIPIIYGNHLASVPWAVIMSYFSNFYQGVDWPSVKI